MEAACVETSTGRVRGSFRGAGKQRPGVFVFRGIPYAAPPRGAARFQPPQPPQPWAGIRDATQSGPGAPQYSIPAFSWINASAGKLSEDCLSLNVWTPAPASHSAIAANAAESGARPVLVWLHGGAFLVGSGATPIYDGANLARRWDCVVVTINYRLGAIGFSHLNTLFPKEFPRASNLGLRDQIAALAWVRENIARFGGNPQNVTVFGQSAGGMSIGALLGAPKARALFHRAICMSGAADNLLSRAEAHGIAEKFMNELGGPPPSELARIPVAQILAAQTRTIRSLANMRRLMVFQPCIDRDLIPEHTLRALTRGAAKHIPLLTGTTLEEWKLFGWSDFGFGFNHERLIERFTEVLPALPRAPGAVMAARSYRKALGGRSAAQNEKNVWHAFQSARVFHWPSAKLAEAQHTGGGSAHSYLVTWRAPMARNTLGSCHAIDIPFVFGNLRHPLARPLTGLRAEARRLARRMQRAWLGFARDGAPGHDELPEWPAYTPQHRRTMVLGQHCELAEAPLEAERQLLTSWARE